MTEALVDDRILSAVLRGRTPRPIRTMHLHTTGCWYYRLCQAVLGADDRSGALSRDFRELGPDLFQRAVASLLELPDHIGLTSLRTLAPVMAEVRREHALNLLGSEAVAAARHLGARVFVSADSPRLITALRSEGLAVRVL